MEIKINPEFERLIPPLAADEFAQLENLLLTEGIRDALVIARYPDENAEETQHLADGHNRYRIATKHGLQYRTQIKDFASEDDVVIWMIDNQKGRRNLTDFVKLELAEVKAERLRNKGREKQKETLKQGPVLSIIDKTEDKTPHNTRNEIAAELGWSTGKVAMGQKVMKDAPEEVKAQVRAGEMSINQAYKEIKTAEKKQNFEQRKEDFAAPVDAQCMAYGIHGQSEQVLKSADFPKFSLLLTDPPYGMDFKSGFVDSEKWERIANDQRHETIDIIEQVFAAAKPHLLDDAHIYVFGHPNEIEHIKPIFERYFVLKNIMIWDREVIGMGDLKTYGRSFDVVYFGYNKTWKDLNGPRDRDVLRFSRVAPGNLKHPTEKPLDILQYLIKKSTNPEDWVLDPFAGSFTTCEASMETGRNSYGIELNEKYIPAWITKC